MRKEAWGRQYGEMRLLPHVSWQLKGWSQVSGYTVLPPQAPSLQAHCGVQGGAHSSIRNCKLTFLRADYEDRGALRGTPGSAYPQPEPNATELPSSAPGRPKLITPPEVAITATRFLTGGSGGGARGCGFEERVGVHARSGGVHFL